MASKPANPQQHRNPTAKSRPTKLAVSQTLLTFSWWVAAGLILVLVLIFHNQLLFGGRYLWEDFVEQEFPFRTLATTSLASGIIPQWDPYVFAGMPFVADIQVAFWYPFNMLQSLFVSAGHLSPVVMQWFIVLHYAVAGVGMFFFAKLVLKVEDWASLFAGVAYACCGYIVGQAMHQMIVYHMALFPWVALAFIRGADSWKWSIVAGLLLGAMYLAGHPQSSLYFTSLLAALAAYEVVYRLRHKTEPVSAQVLIRMAVVLLIGVGIFAIQLLPSQELAALSRRDVITYQKSLEGSITWGHLFTLVVPRLFGVTTAAQTGDLPYWNGAYYLSWETAMYIGLFPLFFAVMSALTSLKRKYVSLFAASSLLAIGFALGAHFIVYPIFFHLPLFDKFRTPGRMLSVFSFSAIALSAIGLSEALRANTPKWAGNKGLIVRGVIALPWLLTIAGIVSVTTFNATAPAEANAIIHKAAVMSSFAVLAFLVLSLLHYTGKLRGNALAIVVIALTVVELFQYGMGLNASSEDPRAAYAEHSDVVQMIRQDQSKELSRARTRMGNAMLLKRNDGAYDRIQLMEGYNPLVLQRVSPEMASQEASADLMNIKLSILPTGNGGYGFGERPTYLPRVKMYFHTRILPDEQAQALLRTDTTFGYRDTILLEQQPTIPLTTPDPNAIAKVTSYEMNEIRTTATTATPGILFFSEVWYPAWHAYLDGKQVPLMRAFTSLRAVEVPAGSHTVVLKYESDAFRLGSLLTILTLALSIGALVILSVRRPRKAEAVV